MTGAELARHHREGVLGIAERRGVGNIRVAVRSPGEAGDGDVVRLVVDFDPSHPGLDFFGFAEEVEGLLARRVEVGTGHDPAVALELEPL